MNRNWRLHPASTHRLERDTTAGLLMLADNDFLQTTLGLNSKMVFERNANELGESSDFQKSAYIASVDVILQQVIPSGFQSAEWGGAV